MFGLIIGTVCLILLIKTLHYRHYGRFAYGYGGWGRHGYPAGPWEGPCEGYAGGAGYGPAWRGRRKGLLRGMFARLDTTPGQEKAIVSLLELAGERLRALRGDMRGTRKEIAALFASEVLDTNALEALFAQHRATFDRLSSEGVQTLAAIHELLDPKQRRMLSELLADGSFGASYQSW